jgi:hypothetical protein
MTTTEKLPGPVGAPSMLPAFIDKPGGKPKAIQV